MSEIEYNLARVGSVSSSREDAVRHEVYTGT
jgi:hypothetical protein